MLLIPQFILVSIFVLTALGGQVDKKPLEESSEEIVSKALSAKDAKKLAEQKISVVGNIGCSDTANNTIKAKIVLKVSRNGGELKSARYSSTKKGSSLISMKRTEPKFLFLEIIPDSPEGSKCSKTIKGKVRMREFKALNSGKKNEKVLDVGDCDFSTGECSNFSGKKGIKSVSIIGTLFCANNQAVRAKIIMKPKRYGDDVIKSQSFDSRTRSSSLLETETKEPNTVFLRIVPDPSMGSKCGKTIEAKLGLREFEQKNGKGVFDVGKCDLSAGKCTKFPFPQ